MSDDMEALGQRCFDAEREALAGDRTAAQASFLLALNRSAYVDTTEQKDAAERLARTYLLMLLNTKPWE